MPVSCLAYSLTLKMEVACSSETSVDFQWTTHCYIPEDTTVQRKFHLNTYIVGLRSKHAAVGNKTWYVIRNSLYTGLSEKAYIIE
jgi:hypothetical protein